MNDDYKANYGLMGHTYVGSSLDHDPQETGCDKLSIRALGS